MHDESPKRFDRIVAILIQLQSKKVVKAQELADRFEVSLRTIYRDIRTLEASGVPLYGEAGVGYSLVDGYRLPPVMFTREEASSFVAAEKLMEKFIDKELSQYFQSAMYKLKSVLHSSDKDWISGMESHVVIQPTTTPLFHQNVPNALSLLLTSIAEKKIISIAYKSVNADRVTSREVEPVGVFHEYNNWYVLAYCHSRKEYRQFRTDRMEALRITNEKFTRIHEPLEAYLQKETQTATTRVVLRVDKNVAAYLSSDRHYYGFVSECDLGDQMEMTFLCRNLMDGFARWFMMFADCAVILEPTVLVERVNELLDSYREKLKKPR